jgi:hypothetical protein
MADSRHKFKAGFFQETTPGTGPSWPTSCDLIYLAGYPDVSSVGETIIPDERTTARVSARAGYGVKGLRNTTASCSVYLTGKDETTADTVQVAETDLMKLLEHCFGGVSRQKATTAKVAGTHTTTQVELNSASEYVAGQLVGIIDADDTDSIPEVTRIETIAGDIITFAHALGFTPADGDKVIGMATAYVDPDVLEDSNSSARQLSWIFDTLTATGITELTGTKASPTIEGLEPNALVRLNLAINAARFKNVGDSVTDPTWAGSPSGNAPIAWGPRTKFQFQDYGTTTATNTIHISGLAIDPGIVVVPIPSGGEQTDNMPGLAGWSSGVVNATASFMVTPQASTYDTDLQAGTFKVFGTWRGNTEGSVVAFWMPRAEITATPVLSENGEVLATQVSLLAHEDLDAIGETDLIKSPILIGLG